MELLLTCLDIHLGLLFISLIFIHRARTADRSQRIAQAIFSFVLPILGPLITIAVHFSDLLKAEKPPDRYMGQTIDESPYRFYWPFP